MRKETKLQMVLLAVMLIGMILLSVWPAVVNADHGGPHGTARSGTERGTAERGTTERATTDRPAAKPGPYLSSLYLWFLGFVGIAALLAMVIGGVMYMFAGANESLVGEAKKWFWNAIWGIVIAAFSYLLLSTVNPDLVRGFDIQTVIDSAIKSR